MNETATKWVGQIVGTDSRFCTFQTMELGVRAGLINLYNGYFSKGLTIRQIVGRYAPASDNNDERAYVDSITKRTGIIGEQVPARGQWFTVAWAILYHENGLNVMSINELILIAKKYELNYYF